MVAKPDVHSPATAPDEAQLERDPLSLPIRLEFGPVLDVLAEAGYVGERLNEWLIDFNQANKDSIGKLELDAEGRLLVTPMQSLLGSSHELTLAAELYVWTREYAGCQLQLKTEPLIVSQGLPQRPLMSLCLPALA